MTPLAPLYLLGALAIAGPILFHLWRRTPRGRREFSTLMFLTASPPRVTSRSRIEHWILLLMRAAVLCLLAAAFARPLLRMAISQPEKGTDDELVAVLIDTSASLRRTGAWTDLTEKVKQHLAKLPGNATIGLFQFNDHFSAVAGFSELKRQDPETRREIVTSRLNDLKPTWGGTNLGQALIQTAGALLETQTDRSVPARLRILLATDLQTGSDLDALHGFEWPSDIRVEVLFANVTSPSNAGLQLVERNLDLADELLRVRISNAQDSRKEQFSIRWNSNESEKQSVYVPPGQSRVVVPPKRPGGMGVTSLVLTGDDHDFDNVVYVAPNRDDAKLVVYCGADKSDDTEGLRFYLEGVFAASHRYQIVLTSWKDALTSLQVERPAMVVVVEPDADAVDFIRSYLANGGTVLIAARSVPAGTDALKQCGLTDLSLSEAAVRRDAMLEDIDFEHPLFAPFAESQFSDFTGIRYWKHRSLAGFPATQGRGGPHSGRVVARFDDGDPAFVEFPINRGRVWLMLAGWQPADSQLARSSKFPPLMFRMLEQATGAAPHSSNAFIGGQLTWPTSSSETSTTGIVRRPDGSQITDASLKSPYVATDEPGLYTLESAGRSEVVGVNLKPDESRTSPMSVDQLESLGVRFGAVETQEQLRKSKDRERQLQIEELEHTQKLWRWGLLVAVVLLLLETWIAGRRVRQTADSPMM